MKTCNPSDEKTKGTSPSSYHTCSGWAACQNPIWKHISLDENCFLTASCKTWNPKILWRAPYRRHVQIVHCTTRLHKFPPRLGVACCWFGRKHLRRPCPHVFRFWRKNLTCLTRKTGRYSWTGQIYVLADCKLLLRPVFVNQICKFVQEKNPSAVGIQLT